MADSQVRVIITTDATGAVNGINQFVSSMKKMESDSGGFVNQIKKHWMNISTAIKDAGMVANKAMQLMEQGAKAMQQESSFKIVAEQHGVNSNIMIENMKRLTRETIDDSDMMQKATKLMLAGYDPAQIERFSAVAVTASQVAGVSVSEAFEGMADAIANKTPKALVQLGAITKEQMKVVTAAVEAGASSMSLYELAMANLELKQLKLKGTQDEATIAMQRFKAETEDTKENIGKGLLWTLQKLYGVFQAVAAGALALVAGFSRINQGWYNLRAALSSIPEQQRQFKALADGFKEDAENMMGASAELAAKSQANFMGTAEVIKKATAEELAAGQAKIDAVMAQMLAQAALGKQSEEFLKKWEKTKQTIGQSGYTKDLTLLNEEYNNYKKYVTDKIALDQWYAYAKTELLRKESLRQAEEAQKSLQKQLQNAEKYYQTLQDLMALAKQKSELIQSGESLITKMNGSDPSLTEKDKYLGGRDLLRAQFDATRELTGQDRIKALEDYKNAVYALQQQFKQGIDASGFQSSVTSKEILNDATIDIRRAMDDQVAAIKLLEEEKAKQIEKDRLWGSSLAAEAEKAKAGIDSIKTTMEALSVQIEAMQKTVEIKGVDQVSSVVATIAAAIAALKDKTITITTRYVSDGMGSSTLVPATESTEEPKSGDSIPYDPGYVDASIPQYARGTNYVPRTGIYKLHQGEAVIPAAQNNNNSRSIKMGDINIVIPASAAPQRPEDWRAIVRNYIKPELAKLNS